MGKTKRQEFKRKFNLSFGIFFFLLQDKSIKIFKITKNNRFPKEKHSPLFLLGLILFEMAKTEKGKKIVPVKPYKREQGGKTIKVKPHRRSTPN